MTVPAPRGPELGGQDVLHYVANTLDHLVGSTERGFREVREDMAEFRRETVSKREFDQRLSGVDREIEDLKDAQQAQADRADRNKKWAITTGIAAAAALLTAIGVVIALINLVAHLH